MRRPKRHPKLHLQLRHLRRLRRAQAEVTGVVIRKPTGLQGRGARRQAKAPIMYHFCQTTVPCLSTRRLEQASQQRQVQDSPQRSDTMARPGVAPHWRSNLPTLATMFQLRHIKHKSATVASLSTKTLSSTTANSRSITRLTGGSGKYTFGLATDVRRKVPSSAHGSASSGCLQIRIQKKR